MPSSLAPPQLFRSFFQGGFESATHINRHGHRLDLIAATQHDRHVVSDYAMLRAMELRTARDALRWPSIDRGDHYDFSSFAPMAEAAQREGVQVIWDLCHFGWPDGLDVFSQEFVDRFAHFSGAAATFIAEMDDNVPFYVPINEISFLSWAAGEEGYIHPYAKGRGGELKQQLVRASIAGIDAVRAVDPRARILHVDPVIRVIAPRGRPDLAPAAEAYRLSQYEAWDMLAGMTHPELGGKPGYLDIVGINYYHSNQWELQGERILWDEPPPDERRLPFHRILADVYARYGRPLLVSETGQFGVGRAAWMYELAMEVGIARAKNIPVEGICLYPIIDRPDWEDANFWHHSALWDLVPNALGDLERVIEPNMLSALRCAQRMGPDGLARELGDLCQGAQTGAGPASTAATQTSTRPSPE